MADEKFLAVARGDEPADLLFRNGRIVNVLSGEVHDGDVAVASGRIAGFGPGYRAKEVVDLGGRFVAPAFIDAHVHIESSMVPPRVFARAVLPRGVTSVVADPHEIANVLGLDGIRFMLNDARRSPLNFFFNLPSCVPASHMETAGAELLASDLLELANEPEVLGLAEVMNFPGVIDADPEVHAKLDAFRGRVIDGHCPRLSGTRLNAYVAAGIGSDHESCELEEAREKLRRGLVVFIREGTAARDLEALLPLVTEKNERRICFCTDDRHCHDLIEEGSIDHIVRVAIARGLDPVTALRMASLNAAEYFRLHDRGAIAPGRRADLVVFDDLEVPRPESVYRDGVLVARDGALLPVEERDVPANTAPSFRVAWDRVRFDVPAEGRKLRVIGTIPNQLFTDSLVMDAKVSDGAAVADPGADVLKMAVVERHKGSGRVGLGFVRGVGLERGAIAGTVAHDHHNLVVIGADDESMMTAARAVGDAGGGQAAAAGDRVLAKLPLPIAGLMSEAPPEEVARGVSALRGAARELGSGLRDPFTTMSFLALEVVPSLKLTDLGLVDVDHFELVPLFVNE